MKKAKIYKPSKTAMQSGLKKFDKWIIEYITDDPGTNPLMGWESSNDTYGELKLEFSSLSFMLPGEKDTVSISLLFDILIPE